MDDDTANTTGIGLGNFTGKTCTQSATLYAPLFTVADLCQFSTSSDSFDLSSLGTTDSDAELMLIPFVGDDTSNVYS